MFVEIASDEVSGIQWDSTANSDSENARLKCL